MTTDVDGDYDDDDDKDTSSTMSNKGDNCREQQLQSR
jgi:hypothetical protein